MRKATGSHQDLLDLQAADMALDNGPHPGIRYEGEARIVDWSPEALTTRRYDIELGDDGVEHYPVDDSLTERAEKASLVQSLPPRQRRVVPLLVRSAK